MPYLHKSGLKLNLEHLKTTTDFSDQVRLTAENLFTNGMMAELMKFLKGVEGDLFFEFIKSIVPLSVLNHEHFPKDRKSFFATKLTP